MLAPAWRIDQIIGAGDLVVSEWSCQCRPSDTTPWVMSRGTDGSVMRDGVIAGVRAYFTVGGLADSELADSGLGLVMLGIAIWEFSSTE
jgi:hypothetical protein